MYKNGMANSPLGMEITLLLTVGKIIMTFPCEIPIIHTILRLGYSGFTNNPTNSKM